MQYPPFRLLFFVAFFSWLIPSSPGLANTFDSYQDSIRSLHKIGMAHRKVEEWRAAKEPFEKMTAIAIENLDTSLIIRTSIQAAFINLQLEEHESAFDKMDLVLGLVTTDTIYYWIAHQYLTTAVIGQPDLGDADSLLNSGIVYSKTKKDTTFLASYYDLARSWEFKQGLMQNALKYIDSARQLYEEIGNKKSLAQLEFYEGHILYRQGNSEDALEKYFRALEYFQSKDLKYSMGNTYNSIANLFNHQKKHSSAIYYLQKGLEIAPENSALQARLLNGLGNLYSDQYKYDSAIIYFERAREIYIKLNFPNKVIMTLTNQLELDFEQKPSSERIPILISEAQKWLPQAQDQIEIAALRLRQAEYYLNEKEANQALEILLEIEPFLEKEEQWYWTKDLRNLQRIAHQQLNQIEEYFRHNQLYEEAVEKWRVQEQERNIEDLNVRYQTKLKERQIVELEDYNRIAQAQIELKDRNLKLIIAGALVVAILGILALWSYFTVRRKNAIIKQLNTEVNHRTLNHLSFIQKFYSLEARSATKAEQREAMQAGVSKLESMVALYRQLYNDLDEQKSVLLKPYLTTLMQKLMELSALPEESIWLEGPEIELDVEEMKQIGLIATELITNAVKYGVQAGKPLQIRVAWTKPERNQTALTIADNGPGLPDSVEVMRQKSFGLNVLFLIAEKQLKGRLSYDYQHGAEWTLLWNS